MHTVSVLDYKQWLENDLKEISIQPCLKSLIMDMEISQKVTKINDLHFKVNKLKFAQNSNDLFEQYSKMQVLSLSNVISYYLKIFTLVVSIILITLSYWRKPLSKRISLVFDIPIVLNSKNTVHNLENFFSETRIPSQKNSIFIVQNRRLNNPRNNTERVFCVFSIDLFLIIRMNVSQRVDFLKAILKNTLMVLQISKSKKYVLRSYRQLVLEISVSEIAIKNSMLDFLYTTNSSYLRQNTVFYLADHLESFMFWYSENSFPKLSDANISTFDYDHFKGIKVGKHLVWTSEFAKFLSKYVESQLQPIGSILFYPKPIRDFPKADIDVLVFDVTPQTKNRSVDFYSPQRCTDFLKSLISLQEHLLEGKLLFGIKPKREFLNLHDANYVSLIKTLDKQLGGWTVFNSSENLYTLIMRSRVIVGIPFTSAILVAKELGKDCCFFIESNDLDFPDQFNEVPIYTDRKSLEKFVLRGFLDECKVKT
jgi:polysaccharide biosynthesis PFTS motif protein